MKKTSTKLSEYALKRIHSYKKDSNIIRNDLKYIDTTPEYEAQIKIDNYDLYDLQYDYIEDKE